MDKETIHQIAKSVIAEVFGTIAYGIVPASDVSQEERELSVYMSCGEVLAARYIESASTGKPMTVDDAVEVCKEIGAILYNKKGAGG